MYNDNKHFLIHENVFLLYDTSIMTTNICHYTRKCISSCTRRCIMTIDIFHYIRSYIMKINIFHIQDDV